MHTTHAYFSSTTQNIHDFHHETLVHMYNILCKHIHGSHLKSSTMHVVCTLQWKITITYMSHMHILDMQSKSYMLGMDTSHENKFMLSHKAKKGYKNTNIIRHPLHFTL